MVFLKTTKLRMEYSVVKKVYMMCVLVFEFVLTLAHVTSRKSFLFFALNDQTTHGANHNMCCL